MALWHTSTAEQRYRYSERYISAACAGTDDNQTARATCQPLGSSTIPHDTAFLHLCPRLTRPDILLVNHIPTTAGHAVAHDMAPRKRHRPNPDHPKQNPPSAAQSQDSLPLPAHASQASEDSSLSSRPMSRHPPANTNTEPGPSNLLHHKQVGCSDFCLPLTFTHCSHSHPRSAKRRAGTVPGHARPRLPHPSQ